MDEKLTNSDKNNSFLYEEANIMPTATKIIHDERLYVEQMRAYVSKLKEQVENPSHAVKRDAKKNAKKALMETGVINKNGSIKKKIVSWE